MIKVSEYICVLVSMSKFRLATEEMVDEGFAGDYPVLQSEDGEALTSVRVEHMQGAELVGLIQSAGSKYIRYEKNTHMFLGGRKNSIII